MEIAFVIAVVAVILAALRAVALHVSSRVGSSLGGVPTKYRSYIASCMYPQSGISIGLCVLVERQFPTWGKGASAALLGAVMIAELFGPIAFRRAILAVGEVRKPESPDPNRSLSQRPGVPYSSESTKERT